MIDRLAVISDVHGNRLALEAVLSDIKSRDIMNIVNLGDCVYGPLDPAGTADILIELDIPTVRGNEDRILVEPTETAVHATSLEYTLKSLSACHLDWLTSLPPTLVAFDDFFLCHGTPECDNKYLLIDVVPSGAVPRSTDYLLSELKDITQPVILCGHDHSPRVMSLPDGRLVVNPGSVGLQAYRDDQPYPHAMEAGTPHARYSVITRTATEWKAEHFAVEYDWVSAAVKARKNGRSDWERWLKTGIA